MEAIILHPYPQIGVGGTTVVAPEVLRALKQRGITVHFAIYADPDYELFRRATDLTPDRPVKVWRGYRRRRGGKSSSK